MSRTSPTSYLTLARFVRRQEPRDRATSGELSDLLSAIALGTKIISKLVASAQESGLSERSGNTNVQGEQTFRLDEAADSVLVDILSSSGHFGSLVSEERDDALHLPSRTHDSKYVVAFDPLDGSSNIGTNIPVGTIFCIFRRQSVDGEPQVDDFLQRGDAIVAAGYTVYGAQTTFVYSCGDGAHSFVLDPYIGEYVLAEERLRIPSQGAIYSVNEGYWSVWPSALRELVTHLKSSDGGAGYSARYVGSLVADFDRTLRKGGIFMHPGNTKRPAGKLRLLYECMPLAFIAEQCGGFATDGKSRILEAQARTIHDRTPFFVGGPKEEELLARFL